MSLKQLLGELGLSTESFSGRLKVQKAVLLLKYLGVSPFDRYEFGLYVRGPYSPVLALDYYNNTGDAGRIGGELGIPSEALEKVKWFVGHDERWLEVASSILYIKMRYPDIASEEILSTLRLSKPWITEQMFKRIMHELSEKALI